MKAKILIVDDDPYFRKILELGLRSLLKSKFDLLFSENGEEAVKVLQSEPIDVLVTDLYMPKMDGIELLAYMSQHYPKTPCIVMTGFSGSDILEQTKNSGAFRFLEKPFEFESLSNAITDGVNLLKQEKPRELMAPAGFVKLLQADKKTCTLEILNNDESKGLLYLIDGFLCGANYENLQGEEAAIRIMSWKNVSFNITDNKKGSIEKTIETDLDELIAKSNDLRKASNLITNEAAKPLNHTEILFQAMQSAKSGNAKQAQSSLAKILKENPKNSKAWLWFARTTDNFKTINTSLKNATLISPQDQEIIKEIEKVKISVAGGCGEAIDITHCLFCWAPVVKNHLTCHYCNALLDINEEMLRSSIFDSRKEPKMKILLESFQRFTKAAILDQNDPKIRFYLSMAHINLDQWDEALEELRKAVSIDSADKSYQLKFDILSDCMVGIDSFFEEDQQEELPVTPSKSKKIMVVEDSATTRNVIEKMLTREGYDVVTAKDGIEAVTRFSQTNPDLILLDIIMPGIDGYETLSILKKKYGLNDTPVIMLTAKDSLLDKVKGKMSGSSEYLTKPFNALDLIKKIKAHVN